MFLEIASNNGTKYIRICESVRVTDPETNKSTPRKKTIKNIGPVSRFDDGKPDFIVTDPPRAGMADKVIEQLKKIQAKKIVYVSCNPATQARDLQLLDDLYAVKAVQPVDMFPHTHHVENVVLLELR